MPPKWAERFLCWYCRPRLLEDLQGDLNEYFQRNVMTKGVRQARLIYILDVLKFFRPYTVRKPEFINPLIYSIMIGSYIKTSGRSIMRNKLFSFINIMGLSISMSVGLLCIAFIMDLFSYDDFHEKKDRTYRVITTHQYRNDPAMNLASTSVRAGKKIQENISGIEALTLLRSGFGEDAVAGATILPLKGFWADKSFFNVFSFPLLQGNPATALQEPYSVVLTEASAKKLFGSDDVLGKTITFDSLEYVVTGLIGNIPKFSHLQFEVLISFATIELERTKKSDTDFFSWASTWQNYIYLVLPEDGSPALLQAGLDRLSAAENTADVNKKITLSLQPLESIALGKDLSNAIGSTMNITVVLALVGLACIIILSACFNYTNLSIARSLRRSREVGIRKVIGALKGHVLLQFITESVIIALAALCFSFLLFILLRDQFLLLDKDLHNIVSLQLSPQTILYFIGFAVITGILAGILPALFFSRIKAIQVFKDATSLKIFHNISLRKALILVQYTFSLIFITATFIGYKQYRSILAFDLGFNTENILNINLRGNNSDLLIKALSELPEVKQISRSEIVTSTGSLRGLYAKYQNAQDSSLVWLNCVDEHYLPLHGHTFVAGTNFTPKNHKEEEREAIVNEQLLKRFNIATDKALGEEITIDGKKLAIVGVLKDFHYGTVENNVEPMLLRYSFNKSYGFVNTKIAPRDLPATMASIESAWKKIDKIHTLDARFYDDQIAEAYREYSSMVKVIGFLAFLAVSIASLGLFGMVVFTTETKLKEISIRKILGATEGNLVFFLSKGFISLLMLAIVIALPLTYLLFDQVILVRLVYHDPIGLMELCLGPLAVLSLACIMIGSQTLKVARSNMAEVLKNE